MGARSDPEAGTGSLTAGPRLRGSMHDPNAATHHRLSGLKGLATDRHDANRSLSRAGTRLLDDSVRAGVWPDSVQVIGGKLSMRLPTWFEGVAHYRSASRRSP